MELQYFYSPDVTPEPHWLHNANSQLYVCLFGEACHAVSPGKKLDFLPNFFAQKCSHLSLRLAALVWSSSLNQFHPGRFLLRHRPLPSAWACHHLMFLSLLCWLTFRPPPQSTSKRSKRAPNTIRVGHDTNIRSIKMKHHAGMDTCWHEDGMLM